MCAIAGIISSQQPSSASEERLNLMLRRMVHRGPDGGGLWFGKDIALGASRLSQLDRAGGAQPMTSPCGRWVLVFNGEIHNHGDLRRELEPVWEFRSRSDTEVLLAALVTWGRSALPRLNGMFAFFFWDNQKRRGFGARDPLGVKPFAWLRMEHGIAFASEARALLDLLPGRPAVNVAAVLEHFMAPCFSGVAQPMFQDLQYLQPGHLLEADESGSQTHPWWRYRLDQARDEDAETLTARLHRLVPVAVSRTLDADQTPAVFLSGGLDSTLVAACAQAGQPRPLTAYTIVFEGQAGFDYERALMVKSDDLPYAVHSARDLGLDHRLVPVSRAGLAHDLRNLAVQNDALPAWEQELSQHHLACAAARDGRRAVLVGDAADETHFGYGFFLDDQAISHPREMLRRFGEVPLQPAMQPLARGLIESYASMAEAAGHDPSTRAGRLRAATHLMVQRWLPRLLHNGDAHTMAHGVEARVPFADTGLLDLAVTVHPELALRDGVEKWLLREAARGLLPEVNRLRRKSSLSKDDGASAVYQAEMSQALDESGRFISTWLDVSALRALCAPARVLTEMERGLLFRVICLHHWAVHHRVTSP